MLRSLNPLASFPKIPPNIETTTIYPDEDLSIRAFGLYQQDLDVNFDQDFHPDTVTKILQCCTTNRNGKMLDEAFFWDLSIGKRIEYLLTIVTLSDIRDPSIEIRCLNATCQKQIEVELSIEELANQQHRADNIDRVMVEISGKRIPFRKPNGLDQLELLKMQNEDKNAIIEKIIQRLALVDREDDQNQKFELSGKLLDSIDNAMSEFDPSINFSISIHCPYCKSEGKYEVKLESFALQRLQKVQQSLVHSIHTMAQRYHWSEQQILSIPSWRRSQYLSLIEKEEKNL